MSQRDTAGRILLVEDETEISAAVRYERGLVVKAAIALAIGGLVILTRRYFFG